MTTARSLAKAPKPEWVVVLPPSAWVATRPNRPTTEVAIGLRLLSHDEATTAQAQASAIAAEVVGEGSIDRYNDELMLWAVGYAACQPNDASQPYFTLRESDVRLALTADGVRRLWDELVLAQTACSPLLPLADDDDLADLCDRLIDADLMAALPEAKAAHVRRLARALLDVLLDD